MNLEPLGARVLVKRKADEKIGIIYIPDSAKGVSLRGDVIAVGKDCVWVKPGDDILFGRYAPFELPTKYYDDLRNSEYYKEVLIMNEEDILLKINQ